MAKANLTVDPLPDLSWDQPNALQSLDKLFAYSKQKAQDAIDWYYNAKEWKMRMGSTLRYGMIAFTAAAGIIPIVGTILQQNNVPALAPAWSAVALALAALMLALDKFGGFTSGWVRYILAAQELNQALEAFRINWEIGKLKLTAPITPEEIEKMIAECKEFLLQVQDIVTKETQKWVTEFQSALKEIDEAAKAAAEAAKEKAKAEQVGAVSIEVANGSDCDDGWQVRINNGPQIEFKGKRGTVTGIRPGIVSVEAVGKIQCNERRDSKPVEVTGGKIASLALKLE
jgi:SMODS and SLOG-associating 2TM effector domain 2